MTLDEAIAHAREVAKRQRDAQIKYFGRLTCDSIEKLNKCEKEHEQLAEWLEELKFLRQWKSDIMDSFCRYDVSSFEELAANVRNKAIDDFEEKLKEMYAFTILEEVQLEKIAEQLKAGERND